VGKNIRILPFSHMGNLIWNHNPQFVALKKHHIILNFAKRALKPVRAFFYKGKKAFTGF
jgi:hypothetical protein